MCLFSAAVVNHSSFTANRPSALAVFKSDPMHRITKKCSNNERNESEAN